MARLGLISVLLAGFLLVSAMAAKKSDDLGRDTEHFASTAAEPSSDSESMEEVAATEAPSFGRLGPVGKGGKTGEGEKKANNSVAGGGIIIAGLLTTISAAVFLYIRVTGRRGGVQ
ncbi:hypothetical protein D8674_018608 [Pyrus ussuriensis x Pyrus communis]|uniref:Transmembrane protein n=1 Tax=Pyrus ussuriensis x Pyrus communis TaxID=2448454 RepID=A0A5N5G5D0_9ROSA|nr:hypothetical protein D8674_018608 [Pyrus ussuriensis x Pyrus communis]